MNQKLSFALLLALFAGCRGIDVSAMHDPKVDFSTIHTFTWLAPLSDSETLVRDQQVLNVVARELTARGLKKVDSGADVQVAVHRTLSGSLNTKGVGYEIRDGRLGTYELQEGTLVVDLVSPSTRHNVWRGTAHGVFRADMLPAEREALLTDVVRDMLADFPPSK